MQNRHQEEMNDRKIHQHVGKKQPCPYCGSEKVKCCGTKKNYQGEGILRYYVCKDTKCLEDFKTLDKP